MRDDFDGSIEARRKLLEEGLIAVPGAAARDKRLGRQDLRVLMLMASDTDWPPRYGERSASEIAARLRISARVAAAAMKRLLDANYLTLVPADSLTGDESHGRFSINYGELG